MKTTFIYLLGTVAVLSAPLPSYARLHKMPTREFCVNLAPAAAQTPAAVTDLKVTADPTGSLKATLTFKAPTKTVGGQSLASITKIEVKNGEQIIATIDNPAVGSAQSVVDENPTQGFNTYAVTVYNAEGAGEAAIVKTYVGIDVPATPRPTAYDMGTSVKIAWNAVTAGENGGAIRPAEIVYDVHNVTEQGQLGKKIISLSDGTTEYTLDDFDPSQGTQRYQKWAVGANNESGSSSYGVASLFVGTPYTLPFHNSFKGGTVEYQLIVLDFENVKATWNIDKKNSVDEGGGSLIFKPKSAGSSVITTGKISMKGAVAPRLSFDYYALGAVPGKMELCFQRKDGSETETVWSHDFKNETDLAKWHNVIVNLPATFVNEDYLMLRIKATANDQFAETPFYVDNFNISDPLNKDLAVTIEAPEKVLKGQYVDLKLTVNNLGIERIENAKLKVTVNDKAVYESTMKEPLEPFQKLDLNVSYKTSTLDAADIQNIIAEVIAEGDMNDENDNATTSLILDKGNGAAPENLKSNGDGHATVTLSWTEPASTTEKVEDDFESYQEWEMNLGKWTAIDADHGYAGSFTKAGEYEHQNEQFAFMCWKPGDIFYKSPTVNPHSGEKAVIAVYQLDVTGKHLVRSNNWLISPQLSGRRQYISFWVKNYKRKDYGDEMFDVLASSVDRDTLNFQKIGDTHVQSDGQWNQVRVEMPEGTRYFAIHHISTAAQAFIFMIDDATFEAGNGPAAYNIYRDGQLIATTHQPTFTDNHPHLATTHQYSVTAVYQDGSESAPVSVNVTTDINSVQSSGTARYTVYTTSGALLLRNAPSLGSLKPGVYIINGKKQVIR